MCRKRLIERHGIYIKMVKRDRCSRCFREFKLNEEVYCRGNDIEYCTVCQKELRLEDISSIEIYTGKKEEVLKW